jgi:hypothetical protein
VCKLCIVYNSSYAGYTVFYKKKFKVQPNLQWLRMGHRRLDFVIYVGQASRRKLAEGGGGVTYDDPLKLS